MGRQLDDQIVSAFENCNENFLVGHEQNEFLHCIGRNVERLIKHNHRQFPDNPSLLGNSKKLIDFNCGQTLK